MLIHPLPKNKTDRCEKIRKKKKEKQPLKWHHGCEFIKQIAPWLPEWLFM